MSLREALVMFYIEDTDVNSDAFALNVGREDWQRDRVADCYEAAQQLQTGFKLLLSFDMT